MKTLIATGCILILFGLQTAHAQERERDSDDKSIDRELLQLIRQLRSEVALLRKEVQDLKKATNSEAEKSRAIDRRPDEVRRDRPSVTDRAQPRGGDAKRVIQDSRPDRAVRYGESSDRAVRDRDNANRSLRERTNRGSRERASDSVRQSDMRKNPNIRKAKNVFMAYDKNKDEKVSFEEWLLMREGKMTDERHSREKRSFQNADKNKNETLSFEEFFTDRYTKGETEKPRFQRDKAESNKPRVKRENGEGSPEREKRERAASGRN